MPTAVNFWFSRHTPTDEQKHELHGIFYMQLSPLAELPLNTVDDANEVLENILKVCEPHDNAYIVGVIPVALRAAILDNNFGIPEDREGQAIGIKEAINVKRSVDGKPPTFEHSRFVVTGYIKREHRKFSQKTTS